MPANISTLKVLHVVPKSKNGRGFGFLNESYFLQDWVYSKVIYIGGKRSRNILKRLIKVYHLSRKYDIIHFEFSGFYLVIAPFLSNRTKLIYSIRGSDIQGNPSESAIRKFFRKVIFQIFGGFPHGYISVSEHLQNKLPKRMRGKSIVIPTPLDERFASPSDSLDLINNSYKIGVVCGIPSGSKNEDQCLKAIEIINKSFFTKIGYVLLDGSISPRDMPETLRGLDLIVSASLSEGSPNIIREAISVGTPVVCHDCGDTLQRFGLLSGVAIVPAGVDFIANGIVNALIPKLYKREKFLKDFNLVDVNLKRINFYQDILGLE